MTAPDNSPGEWGSFCNLSNGRSESVENIFLARLVRAPGARFGGKSGERVAAAHGPGLGMG